MILVFTGDGKGKTTAAVGQCIRAVGGGLRVGFGQFMKRNDQAGEQLFLADLLGDRFRAGGKGFLFPESDPAEHRKPALTLLEWAHALVGSGVDMLILDEALYALQAGLIHREELEGLLRLANDKKCHLVLTGRGMPEWLENEADLITVVSAPKHPLQLGAKAVKGIEF